MGTCSSVLYVIFLPILLVKLSLNHIIQSSIREGVLIEKKVIVNNEHICETQRKIGTKKCS